MPLPISPLESAIADAWKRKKARHAESGAIRLLNADASGTPRLVLELYGKHGILYDYGAGGGKEWEDALRAAAPRWLQEFGWESFSLLDRAHAGDSERSGNHALAGAVPESLILREEGQPFRVEPRHPRNVGLFLDTRELRRRLRADSRGARVLNLFCYTGSLGLAALAGGAAEAVQVDISRRYLDWGRENLRLAGLDAARCRFTHMDSERYLDWAAKKGLRFDRVILDPPVFARFDGKVFRFEADYFRLAAKCAALLSPGGTLDAVTNYAGIRPSAFAAELQRAIPGATPQRIPLPEDFDLPPDAEEMPEGNAVIYEVIGE